MRVNLDKYRGLGYTDKDGVAWKREVDSGIFINWFGYTVGNIAHYLFKFSLPYTLWTSLDLDDLDELEQEENTK